jgi:L-ascorbate metabolism protein UlaG (beta-lactamase superfamily)
MRVEWHGQSAFTLSGEEHTVFIDPFFADPAPLRERGLQWDYPAIAVDGVNLLLVTHEHGDHNAVESIPGEPHLLRSLAGSHETPAGEVVGIASEHDPVAGTKRGSNTMFVFELDGLRVAHLGDLGQAELRPEQVAALGRPDLLLVPVGGGPTIGGLQAAEIAQELGAVWVVPMHYRTPRIGFLESEEEFAAAMPRVRRLDGPSFETADLERAETPTAVVPAAP